MPKALILKMWFSVGLSCAATQALASECRQFLSSKPNTLPSILLESVQIRPLKSLMDWQSLSEATKLDILQGRMDESLETLNLRKHALLIQDLSYLNHRHGNEPAILELQAFIRSQVKLNNISTQTTIGPQNLAFEFYSFKNKIIGVNFLATQFATPAADDHPSDGHFRSVGQARDFNISESQIFKWSVQVTFEIVHDTIFVLSPTDPNKFKLENTGKTFFQ